MVAVATCRSAKMETALLFVTLLHTSNLAFKAFMMIATSLGAGQ